MQKHETFTMTFKLRKDYRKALDKMAEVEDRSIANLINRFIKKGLIEEGYLKPDTK
jgi:hypothetical protein